MGMICRAIGLLMVICLAACASKDVKTVRVWSAEESLARLSLAWVKRVGGWITEMRVEPQSGDLFYSSKGDGRKGHRIGRVSRTGKILGSVATGNLILSIAPTHRRSGAGVLYSAYPSEVGEWTSRWKPLWKTPALCRPESISAERSLCLQDDDADPTLSFEVLSSSGEIIHREETPRTSLAFQADLSGELLAVGYERGEVDVFSFVDGVKKVLSAKASGEISDLALWHLPGEKSWKLAVLSTDLSRKKRLEVFGANGVKTQEWQVPFSAEQVEWSLAGNHLLVIDPAGKNVRWAVLSSDAQGLKVVREEQSGRTAEYAVSARPSGSGWAIYLGVSSSEGRPERIGHVIGLDERGSSVWLAEMKIPPGGYLYSFEVNEKGIFYATDNGWLGFMRF